MSEAKQQFVVLSDGEGQYYVVNTLQLPQFRIQGDAKEFADKLSAAGRDASVTSRSAEGYAMVGVLPEESLL
jgi:hypothetical protein